MYILNMKCREKFHIGKLTSKSLSAVSAVSRITKEPVKTALPHTNTSPKQNQTPQKQQGQDKLAQDTVQHQLASTQSTTKTLDKQEKNAIHHQLTPSDIETDAFDYLQNEIQHHQQTPTAMETDVIDDQTDGYTSAEAGQSSAGNKNPPYTRTDANVSSYKAESDAVVSINTWFPLEFLSGGRKGSHNEGQLSCVSLSYTQNVLVCRNPKYLLVI